MPSEVGLKNEPHLFVSARLLHDSERQVYIVRREEQFAIPSTEHSNLNQREVKHTVRLLMDSEFSSFNDYLAARFKVCYFLNKFQS